MKPRSDWQDGYTLGLLLGAAIGTLAMLLLMLVMQHG